MKARQLVAAGRLLSEAAGHGAVIVGGDFNTTPSGMGALLHPAAGGRYFDVDPQKADTHGRKIDYILFDRAHFEDPAGGPRYSPLSDHRLLLGHADRE